MTRWLDEWRLTASPASTFDDELRLLASTDQVTIGIGTKQLDLSAGEEQVIAVSADSAKSWDQVPAADFAVGGEPVPPDSVSLLFGTRRAVWALADDPRTSDDVQLARKVCQRGWWLLCVVVFVSNGLLRLRCWFVTGFELGQRSRRFVAAQIEARQRWCAWIPGLRQWVRGSLVRSRR